ncbi:hypothetical protein BJP41_10335 (plasmid) [Candidatus Williamhamiltonella defendens]|uniref:Uncharacterized protein n=2 Tax=Candidatus Williamhamiltonella defendens TaxID=138072 RepID=A0A2D3TAT5_9ENTR|nr:hypothetical protein [Candidatus Hamiltonella defensa]ATW30862.1 hypothetical protein BJP41_10335 [Candidatus Hamiltonella defensa]ATW32898.1 hypothetical protein BJP42_10975 [Candidatus Hamiltonella defensa]
MSAQTHVRESESSSGSFISWQFLLWQVMFAIGLVADVNSKKDSGGGLKTNNRSSQSKKGSSGCFFLFVAGSARKGREAVAENQ